MKYKVLILTDHSNHSSENSLYELAVKMLDHQLTDNVDIASRGNEINDAFFSTKSTKLFATSISSNFTYAKKEHPLSADYFEVNLNEYDLVWLRMPPPLSVDFLDFIDNSFSRSIVVNNPNSIYETGSKEFLMNFPSVCAPMKICKSLDDIIEFNKLFPIVLKPFNEYGGRGILKIDGDKVSSGIKDFSFEEFTKSYTRNPIDYLAVKYLKNVTQGDKRIVVVNGEILGASLRLPAEDSWLCNVSMGGSSNMTEVNLEEEEIINLINPVLSKMGIVMYGVDTLMDDKGKRVLSEINTTSIGGLPQIASMQKQPLVEKAIDLIWDYYENKKRNDEC